MSSCVEKAPHGQGWRATTAYCPKCFEQVCFAHANEHARKHEER